MYVLWIAFFGMIFLPILNIIIIEYCGYTFGKKYFWGFMLISAFISLLLGYVDYLASFENAEEEHVIKLFAVSIIITGVAYRLMILKNYTNYQNFLNHGERFNLARLFDYFLNFTVIFGQIMGLFLFFMRYPNDVVVFWSCFFFVMALNILAEKSRRSALKKDLDVHVL